MPWSGRHKRLSESGGGHLAGAQSRRTGQPRRRQPRPPGPGDPVRLKKIQYRSGLMEGYLAGTGLALDQNEHRTNITN